MIMKKHLSFHVFVIFLVLNMFVSCIPEIITPPTPDEPAIPSGNVSTPDWQVSSDYDYSSSMTVIAQVDLTQTYTLTPDDWQVDTADLLAAFAGEECIGVCKPVDSLFFLYITSPSQGNDDISLRYYSARLHNVFQGNTVLQFVNGDRLGSVNDPLKPLFEVWSE